MRKRSKGIALVTGASGFVGGRLARILAMEGWTVRALVRTPDRASGLAGDPHLDVVVGDLCERSSVAGALADADVVFHCAGNVRTWDTLESYRRDNVIATRTLVEAALARRRPLSRFVHVSSVDVYGYPDSPADEESTTTLTTHHYGRSKLEGELEVRRLASRGGLPFTIVRPTNVFGPGGAFVEKIGRELLSGSMITIDSGRCHAGLVYVDNLAENLVRAACSTHTIGQTYNLRDENDVTWRDYLDRLAAGIDARRPIRNLSFNVAWGAALALEATHRILGSTREPTIHRLIVDMLGKTCGHSSEKARKDFGATTTVSFDEGLSRSILWFRSR